MTEQNEVPEDARRDSHGDPYASSQDGVVSYSREGDAPVATQATPGYQESPDHVPDPTAMSGTLETSGTGGGTNEWLSGTTRIFGDAERIARKVEAVVQDHVADIVGEVRSVLHQEENQVIAANLPQQTVENDGVPTHGGNIVDPADTTGAAQADRSANVAGSPDDVDAGTEQVPDGTEGDSYNQQVIAGASSPQDETQTAKAPAKKAAAKKTTTSTTAAKK